MPRVNKQNDELPAFDLRASREARGMTQEATAALLFTHQTSIARWEREGNMPGLARMAWTLHWQIEDAKVKAAKGQKAVREIKQKIKEAKNAAAKA